MDFSLIDNLVQLSILNRVAIVVINFVAFSLLLVVFNHNRLKDRQSQIFFVMGLFMLTWVDFAYMAR